MISQLIIVALGVALRSPALPLGHGIIAAARRAPTPYLSGKYGTKEYWDSMYAGKGEATDDGLPADQYSWYCGWRELEPFWAELVPETSSNILIPGVGNDATLPDMHDGGYRNLTAFDYSADAVVRASDLVGKRNITLLEADATALPFSDDAGFDAVLDKGALDAIGIHSAAALSSAVSELGRVLRPGGIVVSISRALEANVLLGAFEDDATGWEVLRDGGLHIAETGEVSTDLAAGLYAWRRKRSQGEASKYNEVVISKGDRSKGQRRSRNPWTTRLQAALGERVLSSARGLLTMVSLLLKVRLFFSRLGRANTGMDRWLVWPCKAGQAKRWRSRSHTGRRQFRPLAAQRAFLPGPGTNSGIAEWTAVNMALWAIWSLRYDFGYSEADRRVRSIHRPIQVFTDSRDLVDAVANRTVNAVSKDARYESLTLQEKFGRKDTAHRARREDVYTIADLLERQNATVSVEWVKAHSGLELNDLADQLAKD